MIFFVHFNQWNLGINLAFQFRIADNPEDQADNCHENKGRKQQ
jgi:hypothetical protein